MKFCVRMHRHLISHRFGLWICCSISVGLLAFVFRWILLAKACLNADKTADGIQSVEWFRNGELDKVAEYCKADVDITRRVYEFGRDNGFVYYYSKLGSKLKVNVNWK